MSAPVPRLGSPAGEGNGWGWGGGRTLRGGWPCGGGQRGFSPPSPPPRHSSCCAGSGGGLHPRPQSSAGCAGALSAYSLKWEIRALRNGGCAAGAQARVCPCALSRSSPRRLARPGVPGSPSAERRPGASPGPAAAATCVPPCPPLPSVPSVRFGMRTLVAVSGIVKARRASKAARRGDAGCHERG